jgi:hypothetical protein
MYICKRCNRRIEVSFGHTVEEFYEPGALSPILFIVCPFCGYRERLSVYEGVNYGYKKQVGSRAEFKGVGRAS